MPAHTGPADLAVLVFFPVAMTKYPDKSYLGEKGLISAHGSRFQSIVGKVTVLEACYITSIKQSKECMLVCQCSAALSFSSSRTQPRHGLTHTEGGFSHLN